MTQITPKLKLVAISGPSGSGKSTLAEAVAGQLGVFPYLSQTKNVRRKYNLTTHLGIITHSVMDADHLLGFQTEVLEGRSRSAIIAAFRAETTMDRPTPALIITDRSPVDNLVYFLLQSAPYLDNASCETFVAKAAGYLAQYSGVVLLPPLPGSVEADGVRIPNRVYQMAVHWLFKSAAKFMERAANADSITPSVRFLDLSDRTDTTVRARVDEVTAFIDTL